MSAGAGKNYSTFFHYTISILNEVKLADVSYYQGCIDFVKMKAAGIAGTIIRAGQRNWVDSRFKENWQKAKEAGLPRGSYWLYDSREDPKKQAALWWSLICEDPGELVCVPDFEEGYGGPYGLPVHFQTFVQEFQRLSGELDSKIVIYTGYYWWNSRIGNNAFFLRFQLWLAWYADVSVVRVPAPWLEGDLLLWQPAPVTGAEVYGVESLEIDLDWYCCDLTHFRARFCLEDGGTMTRVIQGTALGAVVRRDAVQGNEFVPSRYLYKGDKIEADRQDPVLPKWLHLTKINNVSISSEEWVSAGSLQQYISWQWVYVTEPPPPPEIVKTPFTLSVNGYKPYSGELEKS